MFFEKVNKFLDRNQMVLTYLSIFISLILLVKLVYDDIYIDHDNPIILSILITILIISIVVSYKNRQRHLLSHFMLESSDFINLYACDLNYRFIAVNHNDVRLMEEIFGFTPKVGDYPMKYLNKEQADLLKMNIDRAQRGETFTYLDTINRNGEKIYWQNFYSPIMNYYGKIIGTFCIVLDVTEQKEQELVMERLAYEDVFVPVHNRRYIEIAFDECVINKEEVITVVVSDLDKFKEANDTYGHAFGDQILIDYGEILTKVMPENAVVARLGGDEFAVLLPGVSKRQAEFLINLVKIEMMVKDMPVTASLGSYTDSYQAHKTFIDFCTCADERMYRDKNQKEG